MNTYDEYYHARDLLMALDKNILVETLLKLAIESPSALMLITTITSSPIEKVSLFKENIHTITHQGRRGLSGKRILDLLKRSLEMLSPLEIEPKLGLELMVLFYETDSWALESTTELDWEFELIYTHDGYDKFVGFAKRCTDSDFIVATIQKLLLADDYSMRTKLFDEASSFLPEAALKKLKGEKK